MLKIGSSRIAIAAALLFAPPVAAQATNDAAPAETPASASQNAPASDQIVVTGTRRTDRTITDSAVPIDVLSSRAGDAAPAGEDAQAGSPGMRRMADSNVLRCIWAGESRMTTRPSG